MHRTPIQQHFHNLVDVGLSVYQAETVVRKASDRSEIIQHQLFKDTADVLMYGCIWADLPGAHDKVPAVYAPAWEKLHEQRRAKQ